MAAAQPVPDAGGPDPAFLAGPTAPWLGGRPDGGVNLGPWLEPLEGFGLPAPGPGPAGAPAPTWTLSRSLSLQGVATHRSGFGGRRDGTDLSGLVSPNLVLQANTAAVTGRLAYAPRASFSDDADQNRISHIYAGQALATLVPDFLFVSLRGSGDVRSVFGNVLDDDPTLNRQERVQGSRYEVTPYILQRFGGLATARAGYTFRQSLESGRPATLPGQTLPFFTAQDLISHEGFGILRSGEDWSRLAWEARTVNTLFEGPGIYRDARRHRHSLQTAYALTREVAVLLEGGWEDQRFGGVRPFSVQGPIWSVGARFTPDPDSSFTVRYGQRDGRTSLSADGRIELGVRTTLFASYGESLGSSVLTGGGLLSSVAVDALGNLVDTSTGVPASIGSGNSLAAQQSNLFRLRRTSVSVRQAWERDTFVLSAFQESRTPVAIAAGTTAFAQDSVSVGLSWSRSLTPGLSGNLSGRYGLTSSPIAGDGTTYLVRLSLAQAITPTLSGTLSAWTSVRETENVSSSRVQNTVAVGLRQIF